MEVCCIDAARVLTHSKLIVQLQLSTSLGLTRIFLHVIPGLPRRFNTLRFRIHTPFHPIVLIFS